MVEQTDLVVLQNRLIAKALGDVYKRQVPVPFAVKVEADQLVKDINGHPHAFVIACLMDRVGKAERAWGIPYELQQRLGSFEFPFLLQLSLQELENAMKQPTSLHWLNNVMPKNMYKAIHPSAMSTMGTLEQSGRGDRQARPSSADSWNSMVQAQRSRPWQQISWCEICA